MVMIPFSHLPYRAVPGSGNSDGHPDAYLVDNPPHAIPLARNNILVIYMIAENTRVPCPVTSSSRSRLATKYQ
jgi:hypothetical protein